MNQIMKRETILNLGTSLITNSNMDQFVVAILNWHQNYKSNGFWKDTESPYEPPNLFQLFEYPNFDGESIIQLFVNSRVEDEMHYFKSRVDGGIISAAHENYGTLEEGIIEDFNNAYDEYFPIMLVDVMRVMDAYHLFYCYQDDASALRHYYNPFVQEVW